MPVIIPHHRLNESPEASYEGNFRAQRSEVLMAAQAMLEHHLVVGTAGNVSRRITDDQGRSLVAVTPSSMRYETMTVDDIVIVDMEGERIIGSHKPSSELITHLTVYQHRPDINAVMHSHSTYASALAVADMDIPALIDEMVVYLGSTIKVAKYGFPGSKEMANHAVEAMGDHNAVLLRNHGVLGVGPTMDAAFSACQLVEQIAQIYCIARSVGGAKPLPADVVQMEMGMFQARRNGTTTPM